MSRQARVRYEDTAGQRCRSKMRQRKPHPHANCGHEPVMMQCGRESCREAMLMLQQLGNSKALKR